MSAELYSVDEAAGPPRLPEAAPEAEPLEAGRPNLSGNLDTVFQAAPMFRRCLAGYDRFQVDTYVRWAEDELATAEREREHLVARLLRTRAAVEEARQLLSHSPDGGQFLRSSRRIGAMLAAAADDAERLRAEAEAERAAASTEVQRMLAHAERVLADAAARADRLVAAAATDAEEATAAAARLVDDAEREAGQRVTEARAEAEARLAKVTAMEQLAAEHAERIRQHAAAAASAARLQTRDEAVRMLATARDERRRADAEAAAVRDRLDRDAATRRALLLAEIADLERRRAALQGRPEPAAEPVAAPSGVVRMLARQT